MGMTGISGARRESPPGTLHGSTDSHVAQRMAENERYRLRLLCERDGEQTALDWVRRTLGIYEAALADPGHHAANPVYKPLYEASVDALRAILRGELR